MNLGKLLEGLTYEIIGNCGNSLDSQATCNNSLDTLVGCGNSLDSQATCNNPLDSQANCSNSLDGQANCGNSLDTLAGCSNSLDSQATCNNPLDTEVSSVILDSRKATPGCLFTCIKGAVSDGHRFAADVAAKGAAVIVVEEADEKLLREIASASATSEEDTSVSSAIGCVFEAGTTKATATPEAGTTKATATPEAGTTKATATPVEDTPTASANGETSEVNTSGTSAADTPTSSAHSKTNIPVIIKVPDSRYALACISAAWFGHPTKELKTIGITGTKGKTTTTYMVKSILEKVGHKVGLIGTIEAIIGDKKIPAANTTPESYVIQKYFREMADAGCDCVVMEASSQGFMLHRTAGFIFDFGIFTNIEPDHVGPNEHRDFDHYLQCKKMLLNQCRVGIVNRDDEHVEQIIDGATCKLETYGIGPWARGIGSWTRGNDAATRTQNQSGDTATDFGEGKSDTTGRSEGQQDTIDRLEAQAAPTARTANQTHTEPADLRAENMQLVSRPGYLGIKYDVKGMMDFPVEIDIPGKFSVYNSLTAIAICRHFDVRPKAIVEALREVQVKGRVELIKVSDDFALMIDYAHNAMALKSLLSTLREYNPHRLVTVFGCGGNRARDRRFDMGEVSGNMADLTIITSDNPRKEDPQAIIDDIKTGISKTNGKYVEIINRKDAIKYAIENGEPGDIIICAGKGHETYQEINGVKHDMDERVLIREILEELKENR